MTKQPALVRKLLRQQAAIAAFGTLSLRERSLSSLLQEALRVCAEGLDVRFAKICKYRENENDLIVEAGYGWNEGVVGFVIKDPDDLTPQGTVFSTRLPLICNLLEVKSDFSLPPYYEEHGIVSMVGVVIIGDQAPYGVLEIDSSERKSFDQHDIEFLTGFSNVLGEAVATTRRVKILDDTIQEMRILIDEKSRLLDQKKVLAEELHHRVRNNLQLVYAMLSSQVDNTRDEVCLRGLRSIARRVFTLAQVYDQLVGSEMTRSIDFCAYLQALVRNIEEVQNSSDGRIRLIATCTPAMLDLDVVTSLGIIVTELVTNSFDHAFVGGEGQIALSLTHIANSEVACLTIKDNGPGFLPKPESKRHGLGLVHRLIEQIGGSADLDARSGAEWKITFPIG